MRNNFVINEFYCTQCGSKGIPIPRKVGSEREVGHLKKLFCLTCQKTVNHVEIKPLTQKYTYDDFKTEFEYGNFNADGIRIHPYGELKELIKNEQIKKEKTLPDVRDSWEREDNLDSESYNSI